MRRAPRNFYDLLIAVLKKEGYTIAPFDNCVFFKLTNGDLFVMVIWVDNIYYFATHQQLIDEFEATMTRNFDITKNDEATNILGMTCQSNNDNSKTLRMPRIEEKLFEDCFANEFFNTAITPMSPIFNKKYANDADMLNRQKQLDNDAFSA